MASSSTISGSEAPNAAEDVPEHGRGQSSDDRREQVGGRSSCSASWSGSVVMRPALRTLPSS